MSTTVLERPAFGVSPLNVSQLSVSQFSVPRISVPRVTVPRISVPAVTLPRRPEAGRWIPARVPAPRPAAAGPRPARVCAARRPLRLTRRGRLAITCTAATVLTGAVIAVASAVGGPSAAAGSQSGPAPTVVTVLPGQTLSEIAGDWAPGQDWREVAAEIVELNAMSSQALEVGQRLTLPDRS